MTPEERQAVFDKEGYWPTEFVQVKFSPKAIAKQKEAQDKASRIAAGIQARFLTGWRTPLHWRVQPAFEHPGRIYETLRYELGEQEGHEEFLRQVVEYYSAIRDIRVEKASRAHTKWAIRQIIRTFATHVRGFKGQSVGRKGSVFYRSMGQEKFGPPNRPRYEDILMLPETLAEDGRVVWDMQAYLQAYGVRQEDRAVAQRLIRAKLNATWGIKL
jgi:hypothetical protein